MKEKIIYLFGHRKQHGKDTCANIMVSLFKETYHLHHYNICKTSFAKNLKKVVAMKYGLNEDLMELGSYKDSVPQYLNKTVREILIYEGNTSRAIWKDVWAWMTYKEIFESNADISIISDFRFENEYTSFENIKNIYFQNQNESKNYKLYKILVKRENGLYVNDGADDQLPDDELYYDFTIYNKNLSNWHSYLEQQVFDIIQKTYKI